MHYLSVEPKPDSPLIVFAMSFLPFRYTTSGC